MQKLSVLILLMAYAEGVWASDFGGLLLLLLIPFSIVALLVWALTWPTTSKLEIFWLKSAIRSFGICLIFTPTYTSGGNGKMLSVALYDMVFSALDGDPIYAKQAMLNVLVATALMTATSLVRKHFERKSTDR